MNEHQDAAAARRQRTDRGLIAGYLHELSERHEESERNEVESSEDRSE